MRKRIVESRPAKNPAARFNQTSPGVIWTSPGEIHLHLNSCIHRQIRVNRQKFPSFRALVCVCFVLLGAKAWAQADRQRVEGFASIEFHHDANRGAAARDFRGMAPGFMTAGWWAPGQMKDNRVAWQTALVPAAQPTTFAFIAATSVLPTEFTRGPEAKLSVNGRYALTFTLGFTRDITWREGEFELKYISKRVEYPYFQRTPPIGSKWQQWRLPIDRAGLGN